MKKISVLTLTGVLFYAFLGVCPMQISMMSMQHEMDMVMAMPTMDMGDMDHASMQTASRKGDPCSNCLMTPENFALKEATTTDDSTAVLEIQIASIPQNTNYTSEYSHILLVPPKIEERHTYLSTALSTVVLRT